MDFPGLLRTLFATLAFAACSAHATSVQMVVNGGFETSSVPGSQWAITDNLAGWKSSALGVEVRNNVAGSAYAGDRFVELDTTGNSWISQTLTTSAGSTYLLNFAYSPREGVAEASNGIEVFWNNVSQGVYTATGGSGNVWSMKSLTLGAVSDTSDLKFVAVGTSDSYGGSLDAVSVTAAVPEPATLATMALGLGMLGFMRRRARK